MTNDEARALLTPVDVLALTMYGEARGEPVEGRIAVGCVIRNRLATPGARVGAGGRFGDTYAAVCWQRSQFSCWNDLDPNSAILWQHARSIASAIRILDPILAETHFLAGGVVNGMLRDNVNRATHYYSPRSMVPAGSAPAWVTGHTPVATIGAHLFFKGV